MKYINKEKIRKKKKKKRKKEFKINIIKKVIISYYKINN